MSKPAPQEPGASPPSRLGPMIIGFLLALVVLLVILHYVLPGVPF